MTEATNEDPRVSPGANEMANLAYAMVAAYKRQQGMRTAIYDVSKVFPNIDVKTLILVWFTIVATTGDKGMLFDGVIEELINGNDTVD